MKVLDLPPVWLVAALIATRLSPWGLPAGPLFWPGLFLIGVAAVLTGAAVYEFHRARTTVIPHRDPAALITTGIFRWTRNPIYLADVLILAGMALIWGRLAGLLMVPVFALLLERRFIRGEEARLLDAFGKAFERYAETTRRWL